MTQILTDTAPLPELVNFVRQYIATDADGSLMVNEAGLIDALAEELNFEGESKDTPLSKRAAAETIVRNLQQAIGAEHWKTNPAYPVNLAAGLGTSDAVTQRLIELRRAMAAEVAALEAGYQEYMAGLGTRVKAMFNTMFAPSFPKGIELINVTRAWIATYVTDRGEESAPSPASALATLDQNDSATITRGALPAGRSIASWRLYRSATGAASSAFKLQGEYPAAQSVVVDAKPDAQLTDVCATFGWLEPPSALQNLTGLPNGIMLGSVGRTLYACEPYHPYAWPAKYDKPLQHQISGIVAVGQSAFVGTAGRPYLVTGADSASLSEELISSRVPCLSARSMVAIGGSVFYASPDGLALFEGGRVTIVTKGAVDRKTWRAYNPASMRAAEFDGMYMAFFTRADASRGALVFDYENRTLSELDQSADAVFANEAGLYVLNGAQILDVLPPAGALRAARWHSKTFRLARPQSFAWCQVDSAFSNNGAPTTVTVRIYAEGALFHTITASNREPQRLPPGIYYDWRIEIEADCVIDGIVLASSTAELKAAV